MSQTGHAGFIRLIAYNVLNEPLTFILLEPKVISLKLPLV